MYVEKSHGEDDTKPVTADTSVADLRDNLTRARSHLRSLQIVFTRAADNGIGLTTTECRELAAEADRLILTTA